MIFKLRRIAAMLIDMVLAILLGLLFFGVIILLLAVAKFGGNINLTLYGAYIGAAFFVVGYVVANYRSLKVHQASLGKRWLGLKVIGTSSVNILLLRTLIPTVALYLNTWLALLSVVNYVFGLGLRNQCGHDYLFKTEVVNANPQGD